MHRDSEANFEYSFNSDSAYSYLVLKLDSDAILLNHQTEIICQNPNPAFVPFHIRRSNDNTSIYYNITSKISLAQYLERKKLTRKELLNLLKNITRSLMLHSNYLLDLSGYVVDLDFIYINPASAEISMVYVPVFSNRNIMGFYIDFLKDLVVNSASIDDSTGDNYMQRILNYLKSDAFNLNDFNRLLIDLLNSGEHNGITTKLACENREKAKIEEEMENKRVADVCCSRKDAAEEPAGRKKAVSMILLQLLFIIAAAIACLLLASRGMGDVLSMVGVLFVAAALDILATKRLAEGQGKKLPEAMGAKGMNIRRSGYKHAVTQKPGIRTAVSSPDILKACDTIVLSNTSKDCRPYLESLEGGKPERVVISKDKFIIGRLGSMVDHIIPGSTIGKLHAQITRSEGFYYIKDLNSKNGTYVNDIRIPSNKSYEIKINDRIRFSDFEYVFRQQGPV